jgi:hypothetical protein
VIFVRRSRSFGVLSLISTEETDGGDKFSKIIKEVPMKTYIINVEHKASREYVIKAKSLEEAKLEAIRRAKEDPDPMHGPDLTTSALCKKICDFV